MNDEMKASKKESTAEDLEFIMGLASKIYLVKDLQFMLGTIVHQSELGSGFCYRRLNTQLKKMEQLAYTGYFGAWTDNPSYYARTLMPNTQFHRNAIQLKFVCWFHLQTKVDSIKLDRAKPMYDVYIYHGCARTCGLRPATECLIAASRKNHMDGQWYAATHAAGNRFLKPDMLRDMSSHRG